MGQCLGAVAGQAGRGHHDLHPEADRAREVRVGGAIRLGLDCWSCFL